MEAIAAYVRQLREAQGISRAKLADMTGTTDNTIWRIEDKGQEPRGALLVLIVQALKGSFDDIRALVADGVKEDEGRRRAMSRLSAAERAEIRAFRDSLSDDEAAELAERLANDPLFVESIIRAVSRGRRD